MAYDPGPTEPTALGLCNFAETYITACEVVLDLKSGKRSTQAIRLMSPAFFLASHALEITLKSYLMLYGYDYAKLRVFSHHLQKIASRCEELGLQIDPITKELIEHLDSFNKTNEMRYLYLGLRRVPDPAITIQTIKEFHSFVRRIILAKKQEQEEIKNRKESA